MVYNTPSTPLQARPPRQNSRRAGGPLKNPDFKIKLRNAGGDHWLIVVGPDQMRPAETSIFYATTSELKSYWKFLAAMVARTWPPRVLNRAEWRVIAAALDRRLHRMR